MIELPSLPPGPEPGLYRHYKGKDYRVLGVARHTETEEPVVVYQALYGGRGLWVRPAAMFAEEGLWGGRLQPRFKPIAWRSLCPQDLPSAQALVAHVSRLLDEAGATHRPPPPEPDTCCGRGCHGCVWEGFYAALLCWRDDAATLLDARAAPNHVHRPG